MYPQLPQAAVVCWRGVAGQQRLSNIMFYLLTCRRAATVYEELRDYRGFYIRTNKDDL